MNPRIASVAAGGPARLLGPGLLFGLCLVWQIPHAIALRYVLLALLGVLYLPAAARGVAAALSPRGTLCDVKVFLYVYGAFLLWMLFVAVAIAAETMPSLEEMKGQWLPPTLCLLIGIGAARGRTGETGQGRYVLVAVIFWAFVAHAALQLAVAAWTIYLHGNLSPWNFGGISDHKANVTYTNTLAFSLLLADMVCGTRCDRLLRLSRRTQVLLSFLLLASTYVSAARNGIIVFLLMALVGMAIVVLQNRARMNRMWVAGISLFLAALVAGSWLAVKTDARWQRFIASAPVGWDIDASHAWVNTQKYPLPPAADGGRLELSAYERVAYARAALRFIAEYPFGTQVSRDAFKDLVSLQHSYAYTGHPHNSYLDLAVSMGLPGMLLWLLFLGVLSWAGYRRYWHGRNAAGLALLLVACSFGVRGLLDSIVRDHIVQEFMLTCGILLGYIMVEPQPRKGKAVGAS